MTGVVEGASLGAVFEVLFASVVQASLKPSHFRSQLNSLESTLNSTKRASDDVEIFNRILDGPTNETKAFTDHLRNAQQLIHSCSKVKWWNVLKRFYYARKLSQLEPSLVRFFQIDMAALHFQESKGISVAVRRMENKINELATILRRPSEIGSGKSKEIEIEDQKEAEMHE